jgi:hypothetical protein
MPIDCPAYEVLEKAMLAAADDEHVGLALLGQRQQPLRRVADLCDVLRIYTSTRKRPACPLEIVLRELLRLGLRLLGHGQRYSRADGPHRDRHLVSHQRPRRPGRASDADDHQARPECLSNLRRTPERPLRRLRAVVANDDRVHAHYIPSWPVLTLSAVTRRRS